MAASFLSVQAFGDPLLSFGPDVPLFITASASVRHDDNVLLSPTTKEGDVIYLFIPGVDLHYKGSQASLGFSFDEQFSHYEKFHNLDDHLANLAASGAYQGAESDFGLNASFVQEDQTTINAQSLDQTVKHTISSVSSNAEFALTAKTRIGFTPSYNYAEFPEVGFQNSKIWTVPVDLYYSMTPKTALSVGYAYSKTTTELGTGDSKGNFLNVGVRGELTPKLSGQIRIGETELKPVAQPSTRQLGVETSLIYAFSPKTNFSLFVNNGFAPSAAGNQTEVLAAGISGSFELSQAWSANLSVGTTTTKYLITPPRTDHFWNASLLVTYMVTQNFDLQASYLYRKNDSNLQLVTFDDNVATFTAACKF
jgi:predicted porin